MSKPTTPWRIMADIAASCIGEHEASKNQSPFLRRVWIESGIGNWGYVQKQPWCASFVSWCIESASLVDKRLQRPFCATARVVEFVDRCAIAKIPSVPWKKARKGDVVTFLPRLSHMGIVEEVTSAGLVTVEGNTNPVSSREGDGVYRRHREGRLCTVWALPVGLLL